MEKKQLQDLLAKDVLDKVLDGLEPLCATKLELHQIWTVLSGRYHRIHNQEMKGTVQTDDINVERNQISDALAILIHQVFAPKKQGIPLFLHVLTHWRWPVLIVGFSLLVVGLGTLPVREASFQAKLKVTDLTFRTTADWPQNFKFDANRFDFGPLQEVRGTGWQSNAAALRQPIYLSLDTGKLEIGPLFISKNERLSLRCRDKELTLTLGEKTSGEINVFQGNLVLEPGAQHRTFGASNSELLQWIAEPSAQLTFRIPPSGTFELPRQAITAVEFVKKEIGETNPKSAIQRGSLDVEGQSPVELETADFLELGTLREADFSLRQNADTLEIDLRGKTNSIQSGLQTLKSHKPSLLEFYYRNQRVYFFCSMLIYLIGLLWSIRSALRK